MKQKYAPKSTNRFEASVTEESERAKNKGETIFDDGANETKLKYQYKGRPILKEYYDKYFGKTKHGSEKVEVPRSSLSKWSSSGPTTTTGSVHRVPAISGHTTGAPTSTASTTRVPTRVPTRIPPRATTSTASTTRIPTRLSTRIPTRVHTSPHIQP